VCGSSWECQRALWVGHAIDTIGRLAARHKDDLAVFPAIGSSSQELKNAAMRTST
jgi:hypothetical protein